MWRVAVGLMFLLLVVGWWWVHPREHDVPATLPQWLPTCQFAVQEPLDLKQPPVHIGKEEELVELHHLVLLTHQADPTENGVYQVTSTGWRLHRRPEGDAPLYVLVWRPEPHLLWFSMDVWRPFGQQLWPLAEAAHQELSGSGEWQAPALTWPTTPGLYWVHLFQGSDWMVTAACVTAEGQKAWDDRHAFFGGQPSWTLQAPHSVHNAPSALQCQWFTQSQ